jgi:AcrR family transcriptional regulator
MTGNYLDNASRLIYGKAAMNECSFTHLSHKESDMRVKARVKDKNLVNEKRRKIIDGAIKVFKEKGYHKATIREIAEEAKISPGSVYDYFISKDDILYLFFDNYVQTFFERLKRLDLGVDDPAKRLEIAYRAVLEVLLELKDQVLLAYTQARYVKKNYLKDILKKESEIVVYFEMIIEEIGEGQFDAHLEANFLVFSAVFGVLRRWALKPRFSDGEIIEYLVQSQVKGIVQRARGGAEATDGNRGKVMMRTA